MGKEITNKEIKEKSKEEEIKEMEKYIFDIDDEDKIYVLECLENKKRPEHLQMSVKIRPLSAREMTKVAKYANAMTGVQGESTDAEWQGKYLANWNIAFFINSVVELNNIYFRLKDGQIKQIVNSEELIGIKDRKAFKIFTEIQQYVNEMQKTQIEITETEEKN